MGMTFDATLKDMGRDSPEGFLAAFDRPAMGPVRLLNVDLSTVTTAADLILGLGEPLQEIVHIDFQSSAATWKHADLMVYNPRLLAHHHVVDRCAATHRSARATRRSIQNLSWSASHAGIRHLPGDP
jgi:hypothetical protein